MLIIAIGFLRIFFVGLCCPYTPLNLVLLYFHLVKIFNSKMPTNSDYVTLLTRYNNMDSYWNNLLFRDMCRSVFNSGTFEPVYAWLDLYRFAQLDGGETPLRILSGSLGTGSSACILLNEIESAPESLATVTFHF